MEHSRAKAAASAAMLLLAGGTLILLDLRPPPGAVRLLEAGVGAMLLGLGIFIPLEWDRFGLWVVTLTVAATAFAAMGLLVGAGELATTARGVSIQISRATEGAMSAAKVPKVAPWFTAQPVLDGHSALRSRQAFAREAPTGERATRRPRAARAIGA